MSGKSNLKFYLSILVAAISAAGASGSVIEVGTATGSTTVDTGLIEILPGAGNTAAFACEEAQYLSKSGEPQVPWKMMTVLLPPDADLATVSCRMVAAEYETVEGAWDVAPVSPILTWDADGNEVEIWPADRTIIDGRDAGIYSTDALWPAEKIQLTGKGKLRGWKLAEISVPLVRCNPVGGELQRLVHAEISVDCPIKKTAPPKGSIGSWTGQDRVEKLVVNFFDAKEVKTKDAASKAPSGTNGYVIITTQDIRDNSTKLADFVVHKQTKGFVVTVIDENDIWGAGTPVAGDASATKLREWMQANYESMDLKYALIIGCCRPN